MLATIKLATLALIGAASIPALAHNSAEVHLFHGNNYKGGRVPSKKVQDYGNGRCYKVEDSARSIKVSGEGCLTVMYSGLDCAGWEWKVGNSDCINQLYGSVYFL